MTLTLEERVEVLEGKVEALETNAGPGRADAHAQNLADLRGQFARFGEVQAKQSQTFDIHTGKFNALERTAIDVKFTLHVLEGGVNGFKNEVSGKLERLDNDVTWLRGTAERHDGLLIALSQDVVDLKDDVRALRVDVAGLRSDVTELKTEVTGRLDRLETDVAGLKTDVAGLKTDLAEFKVEVRETLAEILDRLPPKAA